jgi:flagellar biosynthesis/type III secretory pathway protein FliH
VTTAPPAFQRLAPGLDRAGNGGGRAVPRPAASGRGGRIPGASAAAARPLALPSLLAEAASESPQAARARRAAAAAHAEQELEALRERARGEAFEAGLREGRSLAYGEWSGRLAGAVRGIEEAAHALLAARVDLAAQVERHLPKLVLELARKVLHAELAHSEVAAQTVIRGIAERLGGCDRPVVVRLAPEVAEAFDAWRRSDAGASAARPGVRVESDPDLGAGDWVLQVGDGFLDGRVESQLEEAWRLVTELGR